ncbi:MAG: hypothetical protein WCI95_11165 [bacterium]
MPCDICSAPHATNIVTAKIMSRAARLGFNPFAEGLIPANLAQLATPASAEEWAHQTIAGLLSHRNWNLCDKCASRSQRAVSSGQ